MTDFPLTPPSPSEDPKDPAEKKERVVEIPPAALPDKIRIKKPAEEEE